MLVLWSTKYCQSIRRMLQDNIQCSQGNPDSSKKSQGITGSYQGNRHWPQDNFSSSQGSQVVRKEPQVNSWRCWAYLGSCQGNMIRPQETSGCHQTTPGQHKRTWRKSMSVLGFHSVHSTHHRNVPRHSQANIGHSQDTLRQTQNTLK